MDYFTLIRFALFFILLNVKRSSLQDTDKLDEIYADLGSNVQTIENLKCQEVEGLVADCSECYTCNDETLLSHRRKGYEIITLKLNDGKCESNQEICCVSQSYFNFRAKNPNPNICGTRNPEGYPRSLRASIRSVLPGEYPWRAWIYNRQEVWRPLCAATFINKESLTLMTAASCVDGLDARLLIARFDKSTVRFQPLNVKRIVVHEDFDNAKNTNNIALVRLEALPQGAHQACLPIQPALHGTACVAVSNDDYFINQVIPRQSNCGEEEKEVLDISLMCGATRRDDYTPELGAGMYCTDEQSPINTYTVFGIFLKSARNGSAAINTNVTHFAKWISEKTQALRFI